MSLTDTIQNIILRSLLLVVPDDRGVIYILTFSMIFQAAAVAALFGLEARSCGRIGQTFFRTASTAPLGLQGKEQVSSISPLEQRLVMEAMICAAL